MNVQMSSGGRLEPIAVVGMGCRFAGVRHVQDLSQMTGPGTAGPLDLSAAFLTRRFPTGSFPQRSTPYRGGLLDQISGFDAAFFGISPREAARMDPQQRILLEVAWEAVEDAGQAAGQLAGRRASVFVGISRCDHSQRQLRTIDGVDAYTMTGNAFSIAANRISYALDLRGPSMVINTGDSSSHVALHLACRSLWNRESELALAGGVHLFVEPTRFLKALAAGVLPGEGAGIVVLKRLSEALADGDRVYATILSSTMQHSVKGAPDPLYEFLANRLGYPGPASGIAATQIRAMELHQHMGGAGPICLSQGGVEVTLSGPGSEAAEKAERQVHGEPPYLLPLSGRSAEALVDLCRSYKALLEMDQGTPRPSLLDICWTASLRRSHHNARLALVADAREDALDKLRAYLENQARPAMATGQVAPGRAPSILFVFSGQGPQWWAMGRQLLAVEPAFRAKIEECDRILLPLCGWSLVSELTAGEGDSRLGETEVAQPALFALQVALAELWRQWGVEPQAVLGHSLGEVAATCVAGALSLSDAIRVVFHRSRLMQQATGRGKMVAVQMAPAEAAEAIVDVADRVSVAAHNGPRSVVLSGDVTPLERIVEELRQHDVLCQALPVNYAFHSHQMEPYTGMLVESLRGIQPLPTRTPIISTVTGQPIKGSDLGPAYWARNMRDPVLFAEAIHSAAAQGHDVFLEIGPHPVLSAAISQCLRGEGHQGLILASLRRQEGERGSMLASLGALYARGLEVKWKGLFPVPGRCVSLPVYPWQHESGQPQPEQASLADTPAADAAGEPTRQGLLALQPHQREHQVEAYLRLQIGRVLAVSPCKLDVHQPLNTFGMDSIMAVELRNRVERQLGVAVPVVRFLEGITIAQASQLLCELLTTQPESAAPEPTVTQVVEQLKGQLQAGGQAVSQSSVEHLLLHLDQLPQEEIDALLETALKGEGRD